MTDEQSAVERIRGLLVEIECSARCVEKYDEDPDDVKRLRLALENAQSLVRDLERERDDALALLGRIRQWDHLDGAGDGEFWKGEIDNLLDREGR